MHTVNMDLLKYIKLILILPEKTFKGCNLVSNSITFFYTLYKSNDADPLPSVTFAC